MTQQLDLALNMTSTTDKMMSNSTLSYSGKESKELNDQFGSFLDNANKTYSNNTKTNDNKYENNNASYRRNERKDVKSDKKEQSNLKSNDKTARKSDTQENTSDFNTISDTQIKEQSDVQAVSTEEFVQAETIEEVENMDEILQESILIANISDTVKIVSSDPIENLETTFAMSSDLNMELPADAIKTGIQFETNLTDTDTDIQGADLKAVENVTQDMTVSKEDMISSLYDKNIKTQDFKTPVQKVEEASDEVSENALKPEVLDIKTVDKTEITPSVNVSDDVSDKQYTETNDKTGIKEEVKTAEVKLELTEEVKADKVSLKDLDKDKQIVDDKGEEKPLAEVEKVLSVQVEEVKEPIYTEIKDELTVKTKPENINPKMEELKQEIDSAKIENAVNMAQQQMDKKTADKNAKVNIEADDTKDIKDDISGIEFINNKSQEPKSEVKDTNEKTPETTKQKVENVKIQVEEGVKINTQPVRTTEDINNTAKAQETLNKAGLTTENLQKMDAKIKDIDFSKNNTQSDLGSSSQELLMRDMLQDSAQNAAPEAVELKVDFNQALSKAAQVNNAQNIARPQEELQEVNILEQIRTKIAVNGQHGMQKITIGLTPESLGKLHIEISRGMNGISAQILAENPQAKEILDKNLDGLRSVLQSQGVSVNNVNVKVAEAGRSSDSNNNLFNNDEGQFDSNNNGNNSKHSSDSDKEKRSEFEYMHKEAMKTDIPDNNEEGIEQDSYSAKTVNIKANSGNIKYQL